MSEYPLPRDVRAALESGTVENFGLALHRLVAWPERWRMEGDAKRDAWEQALRIAQRVFRDGEVPGGGASMPDAAGDHRAILAFWHARLDAAAGAWPFQCSRELRVAWRLSIGFGTSTVLETGMTLHRVYGIPYLPSSGVKGVVRNEWFAEIAGALDVPPLEPDEVAARRETPWKLLEAVLTAPDTKDGNAYAEKKFKTLANDRVVCEGALVQERWTASELRGVGEPETARARELGAAAFRRAFGSTAQRGEVVFLDAPPVALAEGEEPIVDLDLLNPHYGEYYRNPSVPPADYLSPVPVYFAVLRQGTGLRFRVAGRIDALVSEVAVRLVLALDRAGAGAKTTSGYGVLAPP